MNKVAANLKQGYGGSLESFKAYDIRGRIPDELNEELAYLIGLAYAELLHPQRVIIGRDIRLSSGDLSDSLARGLVAGGSDVYDIGVCGTEEVYFATFNEGMDGGIMLTASHNPIDHNGMKLVREDARPISGDSGLNEIKRLISDMPNTYKDDAMMSSSADTVAGHLHSMNIRDAYIDHLLTYVDINSIKPLKVVVNPGNGGAGLVMDKLAAKLPIELIKLHYEPDGHFPNGIPNPLLPENRGDTTDAVKNSGADLGVAWDGDFDRCFFFDEHGEFIEGYYIVGLLAEALLAHHPAAGIIHDPRLTWNTIDIVQAAGGNPILSKTGHAFIKERMRMEDAVYGGEMSAHHYFRDFAYCDSGMIPLLLVLELISKTGKGLAELVKERQALFPVSGEINRSVDNPDKIIRYIEKTFSTEAIIVDHTDGLSMEFDDWRFNIRKSNTEPLLRLNVETRGDQLLMKKQTDYLLSLIEDLKSNKTTTVLVAGDGDCTRRIL